MNKRESPFRTHLSAWLVMWWERHLPAKPLLNIFPLFKVHLRQPPLPKTLTKNEVAGYHLLVATQILNWHWNDLSISSLTDTDDSPYHQIIRDMNLFSDVNQNQQLPADDFFFNRIVLPVFSGQVHPVAVSLPTPAIAHAQGDDPPHEICLSAPKYPALTCE